MTAYGRYTTQQMPIRGDMVRNNAGGYGYALDKWEQLQRFLIMGTEGGTYYVGERELTLQNAGASIACITEDPMRVVKTAVEINVSGRAPKVDQQLFVLALVLKFGTPEARLEVYRSLNKVLRIGTHLLHFVKYVDGFCGWSRAKRREIGKWFTDKTPEDIAFQAIKYGNRDGWTMRDVLRVTHAPGHTPRRRAVLRWILNQHGGKYAVEHDLLPGVILDYEEMMTRSDTVQAAIWGLRNGLPREALRTEAMQSREVWEELAKQMPPHALLRNLANLARHSIDGTMIAARLRNAEAMKRARVHPFNILLASLVYRTGSGVRSGGKMFVPSKDVIEALDDAFEESFQYTPPTNKRRFIAIDSSGSMRHAATSAGVTAQDVAAAFALVLGRLEPHAVVARFDTAFRGFVPITRRTAISSLTSLNGGGTDMASPMVWALQNQAYFDSFEILTDAETWAGRLHPSQALQKYRAIINENAKLVVAAMTSSHANIVDPDDRNALGIAGFDANMPQIVNAFVQTAMITAD